MLDAILSPTLLINEQKVRANLERMAARAQRHQLAFRPHFKTHQSAIIGNWYRKYGVEEISVTSLRMALEFAQAGWKKIIIAMPANPREIPALAQLAKQVTLSVFLTSPEVARFFAATKELEGLSYFVEVDTGYARSGVNWKYSEKIKEIIQVAEGLSFRGLYVHSGHTYDVAARSDISTIHDKLLDRLNTIKSDLAEFRPFEISIGDTPACSTQEDFRGIDSIGPGNFVYYDLVQAGLGSCTVSDIAVCLAVPVLQVIAERGEVIVHAGWVQLGKDQLKDGTHGRIVELNDDGTWGFPLPEASVKKLSQEHGTVKLPEKIIRTIKPGDLLGILPVHACAAVHGMRTTDSQIILPA